MRVLGPAGTLYGLLAALRVRLYRRGVLRTHRLTGPVISVGNLNVGGSGKTPVVARVAEMLLQEGLAVSVLSRGYGGSFAGRALVVGDGSSVLVGADEAGDEPVMLARSLPGAVVAVGRHRDRVGRVVEDRFGPRVHVLDDGFQHLRLARDLDIVCVAPADLRDRPLPAGRLRERPAGLRRAGIVLLAAGGEPGDPESLAIPGTVFRVRRRPLGFFDPAGAPHPDPRRPFLLAGIARPDRFADDVRARVGSVAGSETFPDHHPYTASEIGGIFARARASGADAVVTTAKDAVRLPGCPPAPPLLVLRVAVEIEDEAAFRERLLAVARRAA